MLFLLRLLPAVACLGMLFVCGRMMFGGHHQAERPDEIDELKAEVARLRSQVPENERADAPHE